MLERKFEKEPAPLGREYSPAVAELELQMEQINRELAGWYLTCDDDSLYIQNLRKDNFKKISKSVEDLFNKLAGSELALELTIGDREILGWQFDDSRYNLGPTKPIEIQPQSSLTFSEINLYPDSIRSVGHNPVEFYSRGELHLSDGQTHIPLAVLAQTLAEDGRLRLEPKDNVIPIGEDS
jgi:hypothetical protein